MKASSGRVQLRVTERLGVERSNYPVTVGVPFPAGVLQSVDQVRVLDPGGQEVPSQVAELDLSRWPDGSVKGLRVDFQVSMKPQTTTVYSLEYGGPRRAATPAAPVSVKEDAKKVRVKTGELEFELSKKSFRLFESVRLGGVEMMDASGERGFFLTSPEGKVYESGLAGSPEVTVESNGPLRATVRIKGAHTAADGDEFMDFDVRVEAFAGAPFVKVTYGFYNMGRHVDLRFVNPGRGSLFQAPYSSIRDIRLKTPLALGGVPEVLVAGYNCYVHRFRGDCSLYYGWCRRPHDREGVGHALSYKGEDRLLYPGTMEMEESRSGCQLVDQGGGRTMQIRFAPHEANFCPMDVTEVVRDEPDGTREVFYLEGPDGWVDVSDGGRGVTVFVRLFNKLPPKLVEVKGGMVESALWPDRAGVLDVGEGSGKSHEMFFVFHSGTGVERKIDWTCEALREPLVCAVEPMWLQRTGLFGDIYPPEVASRPNFEMACRLAFSTFAGGGASMMNYPESAQGQAESWLQSSLKSATSPVDKASGGNNDGDRVMSLLLQFARTGDPACFIAARDQAYHTMDVDFIRYSPDPLMHEGIHMHSYDHVTAISQTSHVWIEGFLFYYYLTGEPEAIFVSRAVGRHLSRQVYADRLMCFCDEREAGWPLVMFSALYQATSDAEVKRAAEHVLDMLEAWQDKENGGWWSRWRQGGPGNCSLTGGGFYRATIFSGLYKWWRATGDERAKEIFRRGIFNFADDVANTGDYGRYMLSLECLAGAYRMLGDRACVEKAMRAWRFLTRMGKGEYPIGDEGNFRGAIPFIHVADELGLVSHAYED